jgi:hypothetical protein
VFLNKFVWLLVFFFVYFGEILPPWIPHYMIHVEEGKFNIIVSINIHN